MFLFCFAFFALSTGCRDTGSSNNSILRVLEVEWNICNPLQGSGAELVVLFAGVGPD